jgi:hypothetical protein
MSEEPADLVTVFETDDPAVLPVAKSLLESSGLPHFLQGDEAFGQLPVSHLGGPFVKHGMAVRFLVPSEYAEEALELFTAVESDDAEAEDDEIEELADLEEYEELADFEDEDDEPGGKRYRDDDLDDLDDDV